MQVATDRAHHHLAGVEPDANLNREALAAAHALGIAAHGLVHPQRGVAGPHGVILMGQRRTEQGHDPVAHHLVDGALVVMHGFHHAFEHGIEDLAGFLRVAIGEQFHRALQIREEHGDLLALAFERSLRQENFFGEVLGDELLWRREARRCWSV